MSAPSDCKLATPPEPPLDALIVGQGIAGSLLGWVLHRRGLRIAVVDDGHQTSASLVAAGMINPVQGQRLNTIWQIERSLPAAVALYAELEAHFGRRFFFPKKIIRLLKDEAQVEFLHTRLQDPAFAPYLGAVYPPGSHGPVTNANADTANTDTANANADTASANTDTANANTDTANANAVTTNPNADTLSLNTDTACPCADAADASPNTADANALHDPYGSVEIRGGGYLDTQNLLRALRDCFRSEGLLIEARFAHADLDLSEPSAVRWQSVRARRVIFAEGWRILDNPFFAAYRFLPTKGQILTVQTAAPLPDYVVNRGKWLVPQGENEAWIGATFERGQTDSTLTADARHEVASEVQSLIPGNRFSISGQRAGVRLAAPDHIPRVGFLPREPRIGVFSAFSSKGNCLAPYLAHCMAEHLLHGAALPARADIALKKTAEIPARPAQHGNC